VNTAAFETEKYVTTQLIDRLSGNLEVVIGGTNHRHRRIIVASGCLVCRFISVLFSFGVSGEERKKEKKTSAHESPHY
jgi:hypothetical protein